MPLLQYQRYFEAFEYNLCFQTEEGVKDNERLDMMEESSEPQDLMELWNLKKSFLRYSEPGFVKTKKTA
jgi:hypothetical protein